LTKEPGAPAVAATDVQNPAGMLHDMFKHEVDITPIMSSRLFRAVSKYSPNMLTRLSIQDLNGVWVHSLRSESVLADSRPKRMNDSA